MRIHPDTIQEFEEMQQEEGTEAALLAVIRGFAETFRVATSPPKERTPAKEIGNTTYRTLTRCTCPSCNESDPTVWN